MMGSSVRSNSAKSDRSVPIFFGVLIGIVALIIGGYWMYPILSKLKVSYTITEVKDVSDAGRDRKTVRLRVKNELSEEQFLSIAKYIKMRKFSDVDSFAAFFHLPTSMVPSDETYASVHWNWGHKNGWSEVIINDFVFDYEADL